MIISFPVLNTIDYLLKQDVSKLYIAVAIRNFALAMVVIFEPIYIYLYFEKYIPLAFLFFAVTYGLQGVLSAFGGKLVSRMGAAQAMLLSFFLYLAYYVTLLFLPVSPFFVPLAIILGAVGMTVFWSAFHINFTRFSSKENRGSEVGKVNVAMLLPVVVGPAIGGWILSAFGYPALFTVVLVVFVAAAIPLFYVRERKETYQDSYMQAWKRVFNRKHALANLGFAGEGVELMLQIIAWPLFLFILGMTFSQMGEITLVALAASMLFTLYVGKVSDTKDRSWLLGVGALWTSASWVVKYFITNVFDALLAHTVYRISRGALAIPFQAILYEKAAEKGEEADEFIVRMQIVINLARGLVLGVFALAFFLVPELGMRSALLAAAAFSLLAVLAGRVK